MKFETTITNAEDIQPSEKMEDTTASSLEEIFKDEVHGKEVLLCCLLDTSASMADDIGELHEGLATLKTELMADDMARDSVKIALITYNGNQVVPIVEDISPDEFMPPQLVAKGNTPMGEAYRVALETIAKWKDNRSDRRITYWRPWLVNFTDGAPTDDYKDVVKDIAKAEERHKIVSWVVATKGANFELLKQFSPAHPVIKLRNADYKKIFKWLSDSMGTITSSDEKGQRSVPDPSHLANVY